jgi:lipoprotein signal peptidase
VLNILESLTMTAVAAGLVLVPVLDQALKLLALRGLASAAVPLGPFGKLQVVRSRAWLTRLGPRPGLAAAWGLWFFAAGSLAALSGLFPSCGWFAGALLGGSFSHALETSLRGCIIDYVRLRFWPTFNLADVAITAGALGVLVQMAITVKDAWS